MAERQQIGKTSSGSEPAKDESVAFAGCMLDVGSQQLHPVASAVVRLTPAESRVLRLLARYPNRVVSRDALTEAARGAGRESPGRSIDVHIKNLRRKLDSPSDAPSLIRTKWGIGYMLVPSSGHDRVVALARLTPCKTISRG